MVSQPVPARESRFAYNAGGYLTLSFIPTLGTMLLGLFAGRWFRARAAEDSDSDDFCWRASCSLPAGLLLHFAGHLPDRETHLDAQLDFVQRRRLFLLPRRVFVGH